MSANENPSPSYRMGRSLSPDMPESLASLAGPDAEGVTWKGWILGLLVVALTAILVPWSDFVLQSTWFASNALPVLPILILYGLVLFLRNTRRIFGTDFGITRQDTILVFCMAMVTYALPGAGFWTFWSTSITGPYYYARPENHWDTLLHPYLQEGFFLQDPSGSAASDVRPVEWFYNGLPPGRSIPYEAWAGPYIRWYVALMLAFGVWLSMSLLLFRRWSNYERLPFPVAEVPLTILSLYPVLREPHAAEAEPATSARRMFMLGMLAVFALHVWNGLSSIEPRVPAIPMLNWNLNWRLFTDSRWREMGALHAHIYPAIIGLTFLLSLEVAFSVWFFYLLRKAMLLTLAASGAAAIGAEAVQGQGTGALAMLALYALWMARADLKASLMAALGMAEEPPSDDAFPARTLWIVFAASSAGIVAWMSWAGIGVTWGIPMVLLLILLSAALARLCVETGLVATQLYDFPGRLVTLAATPAVLGSSQYAMIRWADRLFANDWYRMVHMANILNALQVASRARLRQTSAAGSMALAIAFAMGLSFFTFLGTVYTQGGARSMGYYLADWTNQELPPAASDVAGILSWEQKTADAVSRGAAAPDAERPAAAKRNWWHLSWIGAGAAVMLGISLIRRFAFWFPHPAGYVMWMSSFPHDGLWFSFFLGWLFKWLISKFGGMKAYASWRYFFVGMVAGEAAAALFWAMVSCLMSNKFSYIIRSG